MPDGLCDLSAAERHVFERELAPHWEDLMHFFRIESVAWMAARHGYGAVPPAFRITLLFAVLADLGVTRGEVARALQTLHPRLAPDDHPAVQMLRRPVRARLLP